MSAQEWQPDAATIEALRKALTTSADRHDFRGQADWDEMPQYVSCVCGETFEAESLGHASADWHEHVIDMQVNVVRDLLASPVREPGRSEAEIKAEALEEMSSKLRAERRYPSGHKYANGDLFADIVWYAAEELRDQEFMAERRRRAADLRAAQVTDTEGGE